MKKFNAKLMLPLVASLVLGVGLSTQASALEQDKDFTIKPDAYPTTADCYVHTPKGCPNHVGYDAQGWYPDVHGRHTNAQNDVNACFARAADYNDWCGGDETTQALFVSNTGEVTLYREVISSTDVGGITCGTGTVTCGDGTTLVDGVCTLSPKSCPELTEWHPTLNACQSTVNGVCAVETAYRPKNGEIAWYYFFGDTVADPAYGELVSGTRGGHCLDHDGGHCSASVRAACDTIRAFDQQGYTNGVAGEDLCTTVSPGGGFSFVSGYSYQDFFDACGTLFEAGMRVEQRHGI